MPHLQHLRDAFSWQPRGSGSHSEAVASALGTAGPVVVGIACDRLDAGLLAAIGGLLIGGIPPAPTLRAALQDVAARLLPAVLAAGALPLLAGASWFASVAMIGLVGTAALLVALGPDVARLALRLVIALVIAASVAAGGASPANAVMVVAGALWASGMNLAVWACWPRPASPALAQSSAGMPPLGWRIRLQRLRQALNRRAGWQFALRLVVPLTIAAVLKAWAPTHHMNWVAVTIALLTDMEPERWPLRITQRTLGTAAGVLVAAVLLHLPLPGLVLATVLAVLAALRPALRTQNYLAYTVVMTPLILMLLDAGQPPTPGEIGDRMLATLLGAGLVLAMNGAALRLLRPR